MDDHAVVREGYRRLLEGTPDIVVLAEASNGDEAYRAFCDLAPDVVVMDITLPGIGGIEVARNHPGDAPEQSDQYHQGNRTAVRHVRALRRETAAAGEKGRHCAGFHGL